MASGSAQRAVDRVACGCRLPNGSWNTICTGAMERLAAAAAPAVSPLISIVPVQSRIEAGERAQHGRLAGAGFADDAVALAGATAKDASRTACSVAETRR